MTSKVHNFAHKASFQPLPQKSVGAFLITRKDTIIIAMLVNIALLVVLFATATKKYEPTLVEKKDVITAIQEPQNSYIEMHDTLVKPQPLDEIDAILERFTSYKPEPVSQKVIASELPKKQEISASHAAKKEKTLDSRKRHEEQVAEYYVVKSGDNPWTIARKFHINFADLLKLNDLDEEKAKNLKIGQKIRIR